MAEQLVNYLHVHLAYAENFRTSALHKELLHLHRRITYLGRVAYHDRVYEVYAHDWEHRSDRPRR